MSFFKNRTLYWKMFKVALKNAFFQHSQGTQEKSEKKLEKAKQVLA